MLTYFGFGSHLYLRFFQEADGVINCTSSLFERDCLDSWREWFGSRPVLNIGPPSPPASEDEIAKEKATPAGAEMQKFLDNALQKHGTHSVVYVSAIRSLRPCRCNSSLDIVWIYLVVCGAREDLGRH